MNPEREDRTTDRERLAARAARYAPSGMTADDLLGVLLFIVIVVALATGVRHLAPVGNTPAIIVCPDGMGLVVELDGNGAGGAWCELVRMEVKR